MRSGAELFQLLSAGDASALAQSLTTAELRVFLAYCRDEEIIGTTWIAGLLELELRFLRQEVLP